MLEETLALIKPNGVEGRIVGRVHSILEEFEFIIKSSYITKLTDKEAQEFYKIHSIKPFFRSLVSFISSGPIVVMILLGPNAVTRFRNLIGNTNPLSAGPGTIRFLYGENIQNNTVHGSDSLIAARRELAFFSGRPSSCSLPLF